MTVSITSQGVRKNYGPRTSENIVAGTISVDGEVEELSLDFDYTSLPLTPDGNQNAANDILAQYIPANSFILESFLEVKDAWVGGTALDVGLEDVDGGNSDPDALFDATELVTANLTAGATFSSESGTGTSLAASSGAPVNVGTAARYFAAVATGTFTAGSARVLVRYRKPTAS